MAISTSIDFSALEETSIPTLIRQRLIRMAVRRPHRSATKDNANAPAAEPSALEASNVPTASWVSPHSRLRMGATSGGSRQQVEAVEHVDEPRPPACQAAPAALDLSGLDLLQRRHSKSPGVSCCSACGQWTKTGDGWLSSHPQPHRGYQQRQLRYVVEGVTLQFSAGFGDREVNHHSPSEGHRNEVSPTHGPPGQ